MIAELKIRSYDAEVHRDGVEDLERRCEVGPAKRVVLFTDTMGDPVCRIRNSPMHKMLVAELGSELVGTIQGSIKVATFHKPPKNLAKLGYVLGLRIAPPHRRKGIGLRLVRELEDWFIANEVDYAYMATEKDNQASVNLFINKLGYFKFRTPSILVNPVTKRPFHLPSKIEVVKIKTEESEYLYRKLMSRIEFFPDDIGIVLRNKLSLGTWVAYPKGETWGDPKMRVPKNWAMVSVWNSGELFRLRLGKAPLYCLVYTKWSRLIERLFPCFKMGGGLIIPDFFRPFGFYFLYGVYQEGPLSGTLVRSLCQFVHNMATKNDKDCKVIVTEVGEKDTHLWRNIPHWSSLSCPDDLWCIKPMKNNQDHDQHGEYQDQEQELSVRITLFVDPREV